MGFKVGRPTKKEDVVKYVLSSFLQEEKETLPLLINLGADVSLELTKEPIQKVKEKFKPYIQKILSGILV